MKTITRYRKEAAAAQSAADSALHDSKAYAVQGHRKQAQTAFEHHKTFLKCVKFAEKKIAQLVGMVV